MSVEALMGRDVPNQPLTSGQMVGWGRLLGDILPLVKEGEVSKIETTLPDGRVLVITASVK